MNCRKAGGPYMDGTEGGGRPGVAAVMGPYARSVAAICAVAAVGFLMQAAAGYFDPALLKAPLNLILAAVIVLLSAVGALFRDSRFVKWVSGVPFSVSLIVAIGIMCLLMGLIPQSGGMADAGSGEIVGDIYFRAGLRDVPRSWPFVLLYLLLLLSLGVLVARRLCAFGRSQYAFYLNHLGLWLLLLAAGFGASDMRRCRVRVCEGGTVSVGYDVRGNLFRIPFSIYLEDFRMEEYPPKLVAVDVRTNELLPKGGPHYLRADGVRGTLDGWDVTIEEYMPLAVRTAEGGFRRVDMPGASQAARIVAQNIVSGETCSGWVFMGNPVQRPEGVWVGRGTMIAMNRPEPRGFASDVVVTGPGENRCKARIEVNRPLRMGSWTVYQYGYDTSAGKMSRYSVFDVVYDPWIWAVYVGMGLLAAGSVCLLWSGKKRIGKCPQMQRRNAEIDNVN